VWLLPFNTQSCTVALFIQGLVKRTRCCSPLTRSAAEQPVHGRRPGQRAPSAAAPGTDTDFTKDQKQFSARLSKIH
jgi:hypothetical protein